MHGRMIRAGRAVRVLRGMIAVLLAMAGLLAFAGCGVRGSDEPMTLNALTYDVKVQSNGDLRISETWDVNFESRENDDGSARPWHQLYRTFQSKPTAYDGIKNVTVTDLDSGRQFRRVDLPDPQGVDDSQYAALAGSWYLTDTGEGLELGWNIDPVDSGTARFRISYTAVNAITGLSDAAEFNWQFLDQSNGVYAKTVTGTISWPDSASHSTVRAWLHYEGATSNLAIANTGAATFTIDELPSQTPVEVHALFPKALAAQAKRHADRTSDDVKASERRMAEEWQAKQEARHRRTIMLCVASAVLFVAMLVWNVWAIRHSRRLNRPKGDMPYWRDDPGVSPAVAAKIDELAGSGRRVYRNGLSATMLSLAHKRRIGLTVQPTSRKGKSDVQVTMRDDAATAAGRQPLTATEEALLAILRRAGTRHGGSFTMTELRKTVKDDPESFNRLFRAYDNQLAMEFGGTLTYTTPRYSMVPMLVTVIIGILSMVGFVILDWPLLGVPVTVASAILAIITPMMAESELLTPEGLAVAERVEGLKRYMLDFSDFSKRGVPDLSMWDFYMVYATALGISETVSRQLRDLYPQLADDTYMQDTWDSSPVMYAMFYGSMADGPADSSSTALDSMDLGTMLSDNLYDVQNALSSAMSGSSDSGSGFGGGGFGGFSDGGGGGGMGGR
ncbi:DUF2207 domain-containing protein [Bifidobacterium margollesii]|uniref:DUF2207 domain-containing protein n=1 Tax=Bifidobacterium margollesii TaxID=2020964 RepID=UPI0013FE47A1|nr:DUF2207 domain-containing protein [Bifidobacterium margollesii]